MDAATEREYLTLAGFAIACRWRVMGHGIIDDPYGNSEWLLYLIGMVDNENEMREIIKQEVGR